LFCRNKTPPGIKNPAIAEVWMVEDGRVYYSVEGYRYSPGPMSVGNSHSIGWKYGRETYDFHRVSYELQYDPTQQGDKEDDI
jgi:hypothetical protein